MKNIMEKFKSWWRIRWIMPLLLFLCLTSCKDNNENSNSAPPFDSSQPVVITDFLPKEGGIGQRLVIYGKNFGNDLSLIRVYIGGKEAKVIGVEGESLYCLVPGKAIKGNIEVWVGKGDNPVVAEAGEIFQYQRKMVVSTVAGYKTDRDDQGWKDGKFKDPDPNKMAAGFRNSGWLKFDPVNPKNLWMVCDGNDGLYLINFQDSTITKRQGGFDRPRAIDFTIDGQYMLVAEDRGGEDDRNVIRVDRAQNFVNKDIITRYKQCNTVAVHPVNGEMYFNSYEKGQFYRYDLNKYFSEGLGPKDYVSLFFVHDPEWEYRIIIHPTGNYAYVVIVNKHYILRVDYNWEKQQFNQPYVVCGTIRESGYEDGVGTSTHLNQPYQGVFVKNTEYEAAGKSDVYDFYFTDKFNHAIRKLTPEGAVTTFAGRGSSSINPNPYGYIDGDLREEARFDRPTGIAYNEGERAFYVADDENRRLRKIALEEMDEE